MITSRRQPRCGCFIGTPSAFLPNAVVYVDGAPRGRVLGTHSSFKGHGYYGNDNRSLIAMLGDDGALYWALYREDESPYKLSWKAGGESLPWVKQIIKQQSSIPSIP